MEGTGSEAWQTLQEQIKRPRVMLEGPQPAQSFVSRSFTMHELRNQRVRIGQFLNM